MSNLSLVRLSAAVLALGSPLGRHPAMRSLQSFHLIQPQVPSMGL